jgi:hypothetical protein
MNNGKIGAPFEYPDSYIKFLGFLKVGFKIPYRMIQGMVRGLSECVKIREMHFTQIRRRILKIRTSVIGGEFDLTDEEPMTLIVDASGVTMSKKGYYI